MDCQKGTGHNDRQLYWYNYIANYSRICLCHLRQIEKGSEKKERVDLVSFMNHKKGNILNPLDQIAPFRK